MAGIASLLDHWKKNQSFNTARSYQSSSLFSASASAASFATGASFAPRDFFGFRTPIAYCDAGAAISDDYASTLRSPSGKYFYHDTLKYGTNKLYNFELKPLYSGFDMKTLAMISLRSFCMFSLPFLESHAKMTLDDDDFHEKQNEGTFTVALKKSALQIIREIVVLATRRILERITVHSVSRKRAWRLLKDVPESAARKAGRKMTSTVYFCSVTKATMRGNLLGVTASWVVQVSIKLIQFIKAASGKAKDNMQDENISRAERLNDLKEKIVIATVRCSSSLIFASIGAGIGATLFRPSAGQCIGGAIGDLAGPAIVAVCIKSFN